MPPQQFGGATQSGPKSAYWNPFQARLHQKDANFMEGMDSITGSLIFTESFQLQLRGCGGSLRPSSPGSRGRHAGSASRHPRCPPWRPERCPRLGHDTSPTHWELLEGARLVNTNTRIDTPSRMGKPEIKEPSALHGFCSFSGLGMRMAKQISRRKISNA